MPHMSKLVLYTLSTCPVCIYAKKVLAEQGVSFEERVIDDRADWQSEVIRLTGQSTAPVQVHPDGRVEIGINGEVG